MLLLYRSAAQSGNSSQHFQRFPEIMAVVEVVVCVRERVCVCVWSEESTNIIGGISCKAITPPASSPQAEVFPEGDQQVAWRRDC